MISAEPISAPLGAPLGLSGICMVELKNPGRMRRSTSDNLIEDERMYQPVAAVTAGVFVVAGRVPASRVLATAQGQR